MARLSRARARRLCFRTRLRVRLLRYLAEKPAKIPSSDEGKCEALIRVHSGPWADRGRWLANEARLNLPNGAGQSSSTRAPPANPRHVRLVAKAGLSSASRRPAAESASTLPTPGAPSEAAPRPPEERSGPAARSGFLRADSRAPRGATIRTTRQARMAAGPFDARAPS